MVTPLIALVMPLLARHKSSICPDWLVCSYVVGGMVENSSLCLWTISGLNDASFFIFHALYNTRLQLAFGNDFLHDMKLQ